MRVIFVATFETVGLLSNVVGERPDDFALYVVPSLIAGVLCVGRQDLCVGAGCGGVAVAGDGASVASGVAFVLRVASALSFVLST